MIIRIIINMSIDIIIIISSSSSSSSILIIINFALKRAVTFIPMPTPNRVWKAFSKINEQLLIEPVSFLILCPSQYEVWQGRG